MQSELLNVKEAASQICHCSERHVWGLLRSGRFPAPIRLGRAVRWRRSELLAWIEAGCPAQEKWQATRSREGRS
jgi:excisionase family DNA binding protein